MRNIIICCDGTGNHLNETYSNVIKLYMCLEKDTTEQLMFYDPGVGTMSDPNVVTPLYKWISKIGGLAFGWGLRTNVGDAYKFLMENYRDGDRVYIFGFSRGAYTGRVLAGMIHAVGVLNKGSAHLFPYAWNAYKNFNKQGGARIARNFRKIYGQKVSVYFVGVWDTVSSIGLFGIGTKPFTATNSSIDIFRHAVSIDERRSYYRQNLFNGLKGQDVKQVWFAGVHSDVGGSYPLKESGLAQVALEWMMDEAARAGVAFNAERKCQVLSDVKEKRHSLPDVKGKLHRSLTLWWWPLEFLPKVKFKFPFVRMPNFGRRRRMHFDGTGKPAVPIIHWSVTSRMAHLPEYKPSNVMLPYIVEGKPAQDPVSEGKNV